MRFLLAFLALAGCPKRDNEPVIPPVEEPAPNPLPEPGPEPDPPPPL